MPYANTVSIGSTGIFIAPNAYNVTHLNSSGWLVCDKITGNNGEWHFNSRHMPEPNDTELEFDFPFTKELLGGEWPEEGFQFKLTRHWVGDEEDPSNNSAKNANGKSPMPGNKKEVIVTVTKDNPVGSFGTVKFKASDIWNSANGITLSLIHI